MPFVFPAVVPLHFLRIRDYYLVRGEMDKRKYPRIHSITFQAHISDGDKFFSGSVRNISQYGLCLDDVPKKIRHEARRLSVVISGGGNTFKVLTRTCWAEEERLRKSIGMEILKAPWGWTEFVLSHEPAGLGLFAETEF